MAKRELQALSALISCFHTEICSLSSRVGKGRMLTNSELQWFLPKWPHFIFYSYIRKSDTFSCVIVLETGFLCSPQSNFSGIFNLWSEKTVKTSLLNDTYDKTHDLKAFVWEAHLARWLFSWPSQSLNYRGEDENLCSVATCDLKLMQSLLDILVFLLTNLPDSAFDTRRFSRWKLLGTDVSVLV